jgi:hypothetical protein
MERLAGARPSPPVQPVDTLTGSGLGLTR